MLRILKNWRHSRREPRIHGPITGTEHVPSVTPYQYSPLNAANDEIRIISILPATFGADVRILVKTTRLADDFQPEFEALSYAWGSTDNASHVHVGVSGNVTLTITPNLAEALQFLRYADTPRAFWIDAICVNQQDVDERSQQVQRMVDIYSKANRVVAWLGLPENQSSLALKTMNHLGSSVRVDWRTSNIMPAPESDPGLADVEVRLPYDDEAWKAIRHLVKRSWFERLWVYQEIHLARSGAVIMCGFDTIPWAAFRNATYCLRLQARSKIDHESLEFAFRVSQLECGLVDVRIAIEITKKSKCLDNRDRIYAIASLCPNIERRLILPDYANSVQQVYRDLVLKFASELEELELLRACNLRFALHGNPTWVPNWSVPNAFIPIVSAPAQSTYCSGAAYNGHGILSVTGVFCGTIDTVYDCSDINPWAYYSLRDFAPKNTLTSSYLGGGTTSKLEAFCRTILNDQFRDSYSNPGANSFWPEVNEVMAYVAHMLDADTGSIPDTPRPKPLRSLSFLKHRSFFTTRNGYLGIAPAGITPGDCVSVVLGIAHPLILRPIVDRKYQVVGESFVYGLMYHEVFFGHLPESVRPVFTCVEDGLGGDNLGFRDSTTGRVFLEDPRAGPLPEGLERNVADWNDGESQFKNITTGIVTREDPRLTEEALRVRGVKLVTIDLV